MKLNYLTASELEMSREEVNLQIILGLQSLLQGDNPTKEDICQLLDDVRTHEVHILKKELRETASKEIQEKLDGLKEMGALYDELKKIPWYRFSERKAQRQKIEELRIKQRGW